MVPQEKHILAGHVLDDSFLIVVWAIGVSDHHDIVDLNRVAQRVSTNLLPLVSCNLLIYMSVGHVGDLTLLTDNPDLMGLGLYNEALSLVLVVHDEVSILEKHARDPLLLQLQN